MKQLKNPKYRIGDIVLYKDRYENDMGIYHQSKILECIGYWEEKDPKDSVDWFYQTEETLRESADSLLEKDIIRKI